MSAPSSTPPVGRARRYKRWGAWYVTEQKLRADARLRRHAHRDRARHARALPLRVRRRPCHAHHRERRAGARGHLPRVRGAGAARHRGRAGGDRGVHVRHPARPQVELHLHRHERVADHGSPDRRRHHDLRRAADALHHARSTRWSWCCSARSRRGGDCSRSSPACWAGSRSRRSPPTRRRSPRTRGSSRSCSASSSCRSRCSAARCSRSPSCRSFLQWIGWLSPLWHASELGRQFVYGPTEPIWLTVIHVLYLVGLARARLAALRAQRDEEAQQVSVDTTTITKPRRSGGVKSLYGRNARSVVARGLLATRSTNWIIVLTGVFEPIFYLLALGIGLGSYIVGRHRRERQRRAVRRLHRARRCSRSRR